MTHQIQKFGATLLKLLSMVLVLLAGFVWAGDGTILSADEMEAIIIGARHSSFFCHFAIGNQSKGKQENKGKY